MTDDRRSLLDRAGLELRMQVVTEQAVKRGLPLPPLIKARVLGDVAGQRGLTVHDTFADFVRERNPGLLRFEHVHQMIPIVERICLGQLTRVMVLCPTQYFKSEIFSKLMSAYYLLKHPSRMVALASYGADLAWEISGEARDYYAAAGGKFKEGSAKGSTRNWRTARAKGAAGGMWATGIGGPALGRGWNLGIVDDPIDPLQVKSRAYQKRFALWWSSKWLRGERPTGNAMVFIMQRLALDDPVGFLLEKEAEGGDAAHHWHILALDEIKSNEPFADYSGPRGFPEGTTVESDTRQPGEVLSPSYRSPAVVKRMQAQADPVTVSAQRQQRPMQASGDFWKKIWFEDRVYDDLPTHAYNGGWDFDTAYSKEEANSASAGVRSFRGPGDKDSFPIYIDDVDWDWMEFPQLLEWIRSKTGPYFVEQKASGKSTVQVLKSHGIVASEVPVVGDKLARASAAQPAASNGRVYVSRRVQQKLLFGAMQGLLRVTAEALRDGKDGLDVNDAFVQAIWRHLKINGKGKKLAFG